MDQVDEEKQRRRHSAGLAVCLCCSNENRPGSIFCQRCGMPMGVVPKREKAASGSTSVEDRTAVGSRLRTLVVAGAYLLSGFVILLLAVLAFAASEVLPEEGAGPVQKTLALLLIVGGFFTFILFRVITSLLGDMSRKPGSCESCGYDVRALPLPRCPECGTEIPRSQESEGQQLEDGTEWELPNTTNVSETEFPIDCTWCGYNLTGLGEQRVCPECGTAFDRKERLFEVYGPEPFVARPQPSDEEEARGPGLGQAVFWTAFGIGAVILAAVLVQEGHIDKDRRIFAFLLFVPGIFAWIRVSRFVFGVTRENEDSEQDGVGGV